MGTLSEPQARVLREIRNGLQRPPTGYGRDTGRDCSAWWRTAQSLRNAGFITIVAGTGGGAYPIGAWLPRRPSAERSNTRRLQP